MIYAKHARSIFPLTSRELDRLFAKIIIDENDCWIWTGNVASAGYGRIRLRGEYWSVHRVMYELIVGPIDPEEVIDHLCRVHRCCHPFHLAAVSQMINVRRGNIARGDDHYTRRAAHCPHGHLMSPDNAVWVTDARGTHRYCRACRIERGRRHELARKALRDESRILAAALQRSALLLPGSLSH